MSIWVFFFRILSCTSGVHTNLLWQKPSTTAVRVLLAAFTPGHFSFVLSIWTHFSRTSYHAPSISELLRSRSLLRKTLGTQVPQLGTSPYEDKWVIRMLYDAVRQLNFLLNSFSSHWYWPESESIGWTTFQTALQNLPLTARLTKQSASFTGLAVPGHRRAELFIGGLKRIAAVVILSCLDYFSPFSSDSSAFLLFILPQLPILFPLTSRLSCSLHNNLQLPLFTVAIRH